MKISIFDMSGECVGVAYHENSHGLVEFPPAPQPDMIVVGYCLNDGPPLTFRQPVLWPVDSELVVRIPPPLWSVHKPVDAVDETPTNVTWWGRIRMLFGRIS